MPLPPPSRPKKKRHSGEWNGNEDANGDHGGLADFVVEEKDVVRDKNTGMTTRRKIPFAPSTSYPRQQKESSLHSLGTDKEDKQQSASPSMTASSINQSSQSNTSVTNNSLRVNNPSALPPLSSSSQSNAFRVSSLAASSTSGTPPSSAKRMTRKREDPRWNQVVHLTPAEQSRLYWVLCYGTDNNNGHNASNPLPPTSSVRRKPPARGVYVFVLLFTLLFVRIDLSLTAPSFDRQIQFRPFTLSLNDAGRCVFFSVSCIATLSFTA